MVDFKKALTVLHEWKALNEDIATCNRCEGLNIPLITPSAPCCTPPGGRADLLVVGQSLHGYNKETEPQVPFIGPHANDSGKILFKALEGAGYFLYQNFTITNIIHCHVPGNRASEPYEIENCRAFLMREVQLVQPRIILALGEDSRKWFKLPKLIGHSVKHYHRPPSDQFPMKEYVIARHPSFIMRLNNDDAVMRYRREMKEALAKAKEKL